MPSGNDGDPVAGASLLLDGRELGATDAQGRRSAAVVEQVRLSVALQDLFGVPVTGASVELAPRGPGATSELLGTTGANGKLVAERELELGAEAARRDPKRRANAECGTMLAPQWYDAAEPLVADAATFLGHQPFLGMVATSRQWYGHCWPEPTSYDL